MSPKVITLESAPRPPLHLRPQITLALVGARLAVRAEPKKLKALLTRFSRGARPATVEETARARTHVVGASIRCAGPRCLERSVATALLCRLRGSWPDWCCGVALQPFRAHAWVEVDGCPVGEDETEISLLRTTIRVPAPVDHPTEPAPAHACGPTPSHERVEAPIGGDLR